MRTLTLKYAGECETCGARLEAGAEAHWHGKGRVTCPTCEATPLTPEAYAAKREAKVERYQGYAANAAARANAADTRRRGISDMIPLGQPILVGHHSEGRHRRDIARMDTMMRTSYDESQKAQHWEARAAAVARDRSIHSDDPEAIDKLRAKIADMEATREHCKTLNAQLRKAGVRKGQKPTPAQLALTCATERETRALLTATYYSFTSVGFPTGHIGAEIRRCKERIAQLERG